MKGGYYENNKYVKGPLDLARDALHTPARKSGLGKHVSLTDYKDMLTLLLTTYRTIYSTALKYKFKPILMTYSRQHDSESREIITASMKRFCAEQHESMFNVREFMKTLMKAKILQLTPNFTDF